jgi:hypothetical protein
MAAASVNANKKWEERKREGEREKGYISVIITRHFFSLHSFFRQLLTNTVSKLINEVFSIISDLIEICLIMKHY